MAHLLPPLRRGSDRLAAVLNSVPSIALGPIFLVLLTRESTPAAVSSIHVFFIVFVSVSSGLQRATPAHRDLFAVLGADRLRASAGSSCRPRCRRWSRASGSPGRPR